MLPHRLGRRPVTSLHIFNLVHFEDNFQNLDIYCQFESILCEFLFVVCYRISCHSNSNSTFIALHLYLMIDSKTQKAKIRDRYH